ncbi:MAG: phospholipid carrier-dependent glycosyltransferase [Synechocystis sp.]
MKVNWMKKSSKITLIISIIILMASYAVYFHNYDYPEAGFWDENYYVATAQRYLNGIFFLHEHPPLGQMLIALGEKLLHANILSDQFIDLDKVNDFPPGFSFRGYRFLPVLCASLTALVFFGILLLLTKSHLFAFLLSLLYLFDNALIVHSRGAMLDSPLMLFISLTLLCFLLVLRWRKNTNRLIIYSIGFGVSLALAITTKYPGAILFILIPALGWKLFNSPRKCLISMGIILSSFTIIFILVWQINFSIMQNVNPNLKNGGLYTKNNIYNEIIINKKYQSLLYLPKMLMASMEYSADINNHISPLNLCKTDENGSPPFFWPFGARSINYRWETPDGKSYRYLYLQANPVIWLMGLWGVIATTSLMFASMFFRLQEPIKNQFLMITFLALYWSYMFVLTYLNRFM